MIFYTFVYVCEHVDKRTEECAYMYTYQEKEIF